MDFRDALLTIARRHCIERHACWAETYCQLQANGRARIIVDELNSSYTKEAYTTFPRYLVWQAILDEVLERLETRSTFAIEALREGLADAGWRAQTVLTTNPGLPPAALAAMAEEREEFARFVRSVPESQLEAVEPLQLRRVFGEEELRRLWEGLDSRWEGQKASLLVAVEKNGTAPSDVVDVPHGLAG